MSHKLCFVSPDYRMSTSQFTLGQLGKELTPNSTQFVWTLCIRMTRFGWDWPQMEQIWDLFRSQWAKILYWNMIWESPRFVPFWANLTSELQQIRPIKGKHGTICDEIIGQPETTFSPVSSYCSITSLLTRPTTLGHLYTETDHRVATLARSKP